jgi:hypothetical protein
MSKAKVSVKPASKQLRQIVAQVLSQAGGSLVQFEVGGHNVTPNNIALMGKAVERGLIKVYTFNGDSDYHGGYVDHADGLILEEWSKGMHGAIYRSTIVHEGVHAAFDALGTRGKYTISTLDDETCAFIAQAIYLIKQKMLPNEIVVAGEIAVAAYRVARDVLNKIKPSTSQHYPQLRELIAAVYKNDPPIRTKNGFKTSK